MMLTMLQNWVRGGGVGGCWCTFGPGTGIVGCGADDPGCTWKTTPACGPQIEARDTVTSKLVQGKKNLHVYKMITEYDWYG